MITTAIRAYGRKYRKTVTRSTRSYWADFATVAAYTSHTGAGLNRSSVVLRAGETYNLTTGALTFAGAR